MKNKTCHTCKFNKPIEQFYKNKRNKPYKHCKECLRKKQSKYRKENAEKIREYNKMYTKNDDAVVYGIKNKKTGRIYIGQTTSYVSRKSQHKKDLKKGIHPNSKLQEDYFLHGKEAFIFYIIKKFHCETSSDILREEEKNIITEHLQNNIELYNGRRKVVPLRNKWNIKFKKGQEKDKWFLFETTETPVITRLVGTFDTQFECVKRILLENKE